MFTGYSENRGRGFCYELDRRILSSFCKFWRYMETITRWVISWKMFRMLLNFIHMFCVRQLFAAMEVNILRRGSTKWPDISQFLGALASVKLVSKPQFDNFLKSELAHPWAWELVLRECFTFMRNCFLVFREIFFSSLRIWKWDE